MPTTATDRQLLAGCVLAVGVGLSLIAVGLLLEPPLALLRHLKG